MYHYFLNAQLYIISLLFSFYLSSILIKNKYANYDTSVDDDLEKRMIENSKMFLFEFNYLDELEETSENTGIIDKSNITILEIPFLNNKVVMYYDLDKEAFCYYTKGDVIYKYLLVACRKYVIEHNCRHLYLNLESSKLSKEESTVTTNTFIKKNEKSELKKNINKFILVGSLDDYEKSIIPKPVHKEISYKDFVTMQNNN
jgi:hypothetical protein